MSYTPQIQNTISILNSVVLTNVSGGTIWTGTGEDVSKYGRAGISIYTPFGESTDGVLTVEVSRDGVNYGGPNRDFEDTSVAQPHMWNIVEQYFRLKYTQGTTSASTLTIQTQYSVNADILLGHQLDEDLKNETEAIITRSVLVGSTDGGAFLNVPVTQEGHLEVEIHGPINPFGSLHVEKLTPLIQIDAVYGTNLTQITPTMSLGGSAYTSDALFIVNSNSTIYGLGVIQSKSRLRYRAGQGFVGRFTAIFTTPVSYSYQIAGLGHAEDGVYFGYKDITGGTSEFGILYINRGKREIQTLNLTAASSTNENVTVRLGNSFGSPNTASIAVTNSANINRTAWEISQGVYRGWDSFASGSSIVFVSNSSGDVTGTFGLTASTAVGTFTETRSGATSTEQFIPQSQWNGDKLNGSGGTQNASGVLLDPTKGNVYQIGLQYLGFGAIDFKIETASNDANNAIWSTVHTLKLPNTLSTTSFRNPSFPFTMASYSAGSTTPLEVKSGSFAGFIAGDIVTTGNRFTYDNTRAAYITTSTYKPFFTILNGLVYNGEVSQVVINLLSIAASIEDSATNGTLYLIKNGTLVGNPVFTKYSNTSATLVDTGSTSVTFSDNNQIIFSLPIGLKSNGFVQFGEAINLQPGEWVSVCGRADSTTIDYMSASLNTREDQ